ncbi:MAG: hypothetical protein LBL50_04120 [Candidatus Margulisbacteria bacterium]|jgi:hypothetical protein|nr:hypothetical protein [Candidatus Margulisiibacteriota bacterium]
MLNVFSQEQKIEKILASLYVENPSGTISVQKEWQRKLNAVLEEQYRCESRDKFNARLDNFYLEVKNNLLTAICGEIGNNAFDHNLGDWRDISGLYFNWQIKGFVLLVDRGVGVRKTLSKVRPNIGSDEEALRIAFTERVSGRSPEKRGNGLKFVAKIVTEQNWDLYFQSGKGFCEISGGKINFGKTERQSANVGSVALTTNQVFPTKREDTVFGCVVLLKYK